MGSRCQPRRRCLLCVVVSEIEVFRPAVVTLYSWKSVSCFVKNFEIWKLKIWVARVVLVAHASSGRGAWLEPSRRLLSCVCNFPIRLLLLLLLHCTQLFMLYQGQCADEWCMVVQMQWSEHLSSSLVFLGLLTNWSALKNSADQLAR